MHCWGEHRLMELEEIDETESTIMSALDYRIRDGELFKL